MAVSLKEKSVNLTSSINQPDLYDCIDHYISEIYNQTEKQNNDVTLIKSLLKDPPLRILEPFCGNGRILISLAKEGYQITGIDHSEQMLKGLKRQARNLPLRVQQRITLKKEDVLSAFWPGGCDVVILGDNCLWELANPLEQEICFQLAALSLNPGGYLYVDSNHMEGNLHQSWQQLNQLENSFPTGLCSDGTVVEGSRERYWFDAEQRLVKYRRSVKITTPDGRILHKKWEQQTHPPSTEDITKYLDNYGFEIEQQWGDHGKTPYNDHSERVIFWARSRN